MSTCYVLVIDCQKYVEKVNYCQSLRTYLTSVCMVTAAYAAAFKPLAC